MKTILVVDDDSNQLLLYKQELQTEGYNVITATDGRIAVKKVADYVPDLVVMDILMPNVNKLESLGPLLRRHKIIPVIINTAMPNYRTNFISWSPAAYITKSSDLTYLKEKIRELIGKNDETTY